MVSPVFFSGIGLGVGHGERGVQFTDVFVKSIFIVEHVAGSQIFGIV